MVSPGSFRDEIERFKDKVRQAAVERQVDIVMTLFDSIVNRNPVADPRRWKRPRKGYVGGQSRRNWRISLRFPTKSVKPGRDAGGSRTIAEAEAVLAKLQKPTDMWISNPMPYMPPLEGGYSRQAPAGIVGVAAREVAAAFGLRYTP